MKYIIFKSESLGEEYPVLFPGHLNHSDVARAVTRQFRDLPVSAGQTGETIIREAHGESTTLGIKSRGDVDTNIINRWGLT